MSASSQVKIEAFDPSKISLELWLSLLEANFANLDIREDGKKRNVLLVSVGTEVYSVLGNICAPNLPHTKSYDELVLALKNYYDVKPSYHRSLLVFQQRVKKADENLNVLYADLKALAKNCNFGAQFDSRVRDQLFMAVKDEVYFPNLVAENIDLQRMTSSAIYERIQNLEKAFVSEKSDPQSVKWVNTGFRKVSCKHCGFSHGSGDCKFKDRVCHKCKQQGHLQRVCANRAKDLRSTPRKYDKRSLKVLHDSGDQLVMEEEEEDKLLSVKDKICTVSPEAFNFVINDISVPFEIDTGAAVSTLSKQWVDLLQLKVEPSSKRLCAYDNMDIKVMGKTTASVQYNGCNVVQPFYVVDAQNTNLCGKDLMGRVGIYLAGIDEDSKVNQIANAEGLLDKYSVDLSQPVSGILAKIHVKSDATPKFMKARTVPFYYKQMVEDALGHMVKENILEPVSCSEWAAPIVPVLKSDKKSLRICGDFKELNKQVQCERYPLPKIEELLSVIGKGKVFSKIDLQNAYLQIPVDEKSQNLLVINTHKGLFRYKRLPFGLSSSPGIFQRFISGLLAHVEGVAAYLDDIIICGINKDEHDGRLKRVLQILQEHNVKINKKKSQLHVDSLEYLSYHISGQGIKPSTRKLQAIIEAPSPTSTAEVHSFIGMVTYYSKFVQNFSSKLSPLYELLKKNVKFRWTAVEQNAFQSIKDDLMDSTLLANFDGESPLIIEVDASPVGVGCVLLQRVNGKERPVYFASKKLSEAERNYSQIDREGLALVFAVKRFRYFLLGRPFVARTDHKPLIGLFGKGKPVPGNANSRIQRWALLLSQYDYELVHKPGKDNLIADALSRLPIQDDIVSGTPEEYIRLVEVLEFEDITFERIKRFTKKDVVLCQLLNCLKFGWSKDSSLLLVEYAHVKAELSLHNDVILYKNRVVVPAELQCKVLEHLHVGHNGISAMKTEARNWVWWPKMDQDIEEVTKSCNICCRNFRSQASPVLSWSGSGSPWSRIHIDYAGPVENKYFLVVVDSFTKFLDVHVTNSMTSTVTIDLLRKSFCNFGLPDVIVSDNAPYFVSQEMQQFLKKNGIKHVTPAPYHPSSNGLAERAVRTLKEGLRKFVQGNINTRICRFLYNQRKTVHTTTGKSPAELMFHRNFRVTIESVKQERRDTESLTQIGDRAFDDESKLFKVGDAVFVRNFGRGEPWVKGKIVEVLGVRNYRVQVQDYGNMIWNRHADQIMKRFLVGEDNENHEQLDTNQVPNVVVGVPQEIRVAGSVGQSGVINQSENAGTGQHIASSEEESKGASEHVPVNGDIKSPVRASLSPPVRSRSGRVLKPPDRLNL